MKKRNLLITVSVILSVLLFVSCGKTGLDENGFYQDIDSASKQAQKKNQDILVVITMNGDDYYSAEFTDTILKSDTFKKEIASKYAVVCMDFSQNSYQKTVIDPNSSKDDQKKAEEYAKLMQKNSRLASMLNAQATPSFYLLTKEQYYICELYYTDEIKDYEGFASLFAINEEIINSFHSKVEEIAKSSAQDKITAIDALYEATDAVYRPFLSPLISQLISLDKNNESGLLSKYLLAQADVKGTEFYMSGDMLGASNVYKDVCNEEYLSPEHRQQAYYMAAYILSMSGSTDYKTVIQYLQNSIDANPDSSEVDYIKNILNTILDSVSQMGVDVSTLSD